MTTAHVFVDEVVKFSMKQPETELQKRLTVAVLDQVEGISGEDARRAVLAVQAMMAWIMTE